MPPQKPAIQPDPPTNPGAADASAPKFRLHTALIVPFVLQVITVAGLVSYLYFRNEQKAVDDIATQSRQEIAVRVEQNLRSYLAIPHLVNQNNAIAINLGQLNLQNLSGLEQYFWRQLKVFDALTLAGLGFENKDFLGAERNDDGVLTLRVSTQASGYDFRTHITDQTGKRLQLLHHKPNFDPRTRPWYKAAVAAGGPAWSEIYPNTAGLTAYLGASLPFYNKQGDLQGVLLTNINLSQIGNFLQGLKIGKTGQVFIIERSGLLVATSTGEKPFRTVQKDFGAERVKAIDSRNVLTQATMQYLNQNFTANGNITIQQSELLEFNVKGEREFLQVLPFQDQFGLDWLIVVVVPQSDFTGQFTANTRNTIQLTLVALAVAIGLGIVTAHYITFPILRVSQASEAIAQGDLDQHVASSPIIEIETLTRSFNSMAGQLQSSFAALKQSETQNRVIVEALPDLIFRARADGTYVDHPPGQNRLQPLLIGDRWLKGESPANTLQPLQAQQGMQAIEQALRTGELQVYEQQLVINDETIHEEVRVVKIADDEVLIVVRDITERKHQKEILEARVKERTTELAKANAALTASEAELRGLFAAMDDVIIVYDRQGICLKVASTNPALLITSSEKMIGQPIQDVLPETQANLQLKAIQQALETRQTTTCEYSLLIGDGSTLASECKFWFSANFSPLSDETVIMVARNITERKRIEDDHKRAEAELQAQQAFLRQVIDAVPSSIFVKDRKGRFLSVNQAAAAIYGVTVEEMLGRTDLDFNRDREEVEGYLADNEEVMLTRQTKIISDQAICNRQGALRWYQTSISPFLDADGEAKGIIGALADITDRKQAEAALQNSLTQLALANREIQSLNQQLESENLRLSAELSVARQLQQMILPKEKELRQIKGLEIAGFMKPADEVGGDYYDVLHHNGSVKIGIGDVTGHGLESGVLMIMVQTAVRTLLTNNETDPQRFLNTLNQVIYDNVRRMNSNKNVSIALLDYEAGQVKLSGQHEEMLVVRADGQIERIDTLKLGFFLGLLPDISEFIAQAEVQLQPGDGVVLYTDGITEARNAAREYYGLERLCRVISENWRQSAIEIRQAVVADVQAYIGQQKVHDDITLLVLKQK